LNITSLIGAKFEQPGIFHYPAIETLVTTLMRNREDVSWQIWNLIAFQAWHESHMR
jgi:hypothetical protein